MHFNWTPGIGDPTLAGWLTVALYLVGAVLCWRLARQAGLENAVRSRERRTWRAISVLFLALGINKQLDLQTALTEAGRVLAHYQGGYEHRVSPDKALDAENAPHLSTTAFCGGTGFWKWYNRRGISEGLPGADGPELPMSGGKRSSMIDRYLTQLNSNAQSDSNDSLI